jgi:hypothetical protein
VEPTIDERVLKLNPLTEDDVAENHNLCVNSGTPL